MSKIKSFDKVLIQLNTMLSSGSFFDALLQSGLQAKKSNEFAEYQRPEKVVARDPRGDRVFPLETVAIQQFRTEHKRDIAGVTIHSGGYADEIARSYNALAITLADHIYFRSNAYNPYSEEGRKLLAHELTHVAQHKEGLIHPNITKDTLELDAEMGEKRAEYEDDPIITIEVNGNRYSFRQSKKLEYAARVKGYIEEWIQDQRLVLGEKEYLKLLCVYEEWLRT